MTLSPTLMRMKFLRILPEICASTSWPLGRATRNIVPGSTCVTEPVNSIGSSFGTPAYLDLNTLRCSNQPYSLATDRFSRNAVIQKLGFWALGPQNQVIFAEMSCIRASFKARNLSALKASIQRQGQARQAEELRPVLAWVMS